MAHSSHHFASLCLSDKFIVVAAPWPRCVSLCLIPTTEYTDNTEKNKIMTEKFKVLVVDDDESIRWVLEKGLKKKGYQVDLAENGVEAIKKVTKEDGYFMVFLDIFMPDMNGLDVLNKI